MMSTVYEVMTPNVVTITPDQNVESAARIMANHGISSIIVFDGIDPVGILTEKDILTRIVAAGHDPRKVSVAEIMTSEIVACSPDTTIEEACRTMKEKRIKKLAVMDNETLAGIVSLTDIAIRQPELIESLKNGNGSHGFVDDIYQLLNLSEGQRLEFKSSLRYDLNTRQVNQNLESARAENDYLVIRHQNRDGFENHLLGLISNCIGNYYLPYVGMIFHNVLGKDLCQINIRSTPKPAFLNNCGKQEFYVRTGNASRPFSISEASEYIQDRWG